MRNNRLIIVVSGPSGAGKSTILKTLPQDEFYFSVSHTTRAPRPGEIHGKHYYFVSEEEFLRMIEKDEFLEWVRVYDTYYGTAKSEINKAFSQNKHLVLDIEIVGATRLRKIFGKDAIFIFISPPDLETLKNRLISRGTEDEEKIKKRIERAKTELLFASWFDYVIVNKDLKKSIEEFFSIIKAESLKPFRNSDFTCVMESL